MTVVCIRCRPMKAPTPTGMGRVCAARAKAVEPEVVERDLFGYDIDGAARAAMERLAMEIEMSAALAFLRTKRAFRAARVELLGLEDRN